MAKGFTLYELDEEYLQIEEMLVESEGEITEEIEQALEKLSGDREQKLFGYFKWLKNLQSTAKSVKEEVAAWKKKQASIENTVHKVKARVKQSMELSGDEVIEFGNKQRLKIQNNTQYSTEIHVVTMALPKKYRVQKWEPRTTYMKNDWIEACKSFEQADKLLEAHHNEQTEAPKELHDQREKALKVIDEIEQYASFEKGTHLRLYG